MKARALRMGLCCIGIAILLLVGGLYATEYRPPSMLEIDPSCTEDSTVLQAGVPFSVLSWNLQYGASRRHHFFYDGGDTVQVPLEDVETTVAGISALIRDADADLNLLQEVDRDSHRTHNHDQLLPFAEAAQSACQASASYHKSPFVPHPPTDPMGRVQMDLALLTKPTMERAIRHQLPLLNESRIRQAFNLKRALLEAHIPINGAEADHLAIAVTHLSAFSHGDGTMSKQITALEQWMAQHPPDQPWILAGDLNLLPPDDNPARLGEDAELYADGDNPIASMVARFEAVLQPLTDPENRTYIPFDATEPDRKIDYIFFGGPLILEDSRVLKEESLRGDLSDHLPIWARFHIQTPEG